MKFLIILSIIWICAQAQINLKEKEWWATTVIYQIYPRSFKDSDGDGIGDIHGIITELNHIKDAGIEAIWISPIFKSPMIDFGYDIEDFCSIDPIFGKNEDFKLLSAEAKKLGIKIIFDFVPNHTSDKHEWFIKSVGNDEKYKDYYIWRDQNGTDNEGNPIPPNNWQSLFYGPAWQWNEQRNQFYLHQFDKSQPDLDYRNKNVVKDMKDVLIYWLNEGVDGFRIDAINHLFEAEDMPNEPVNPGATDKNDYFSYTDHIYTKDQNETYDMVYQWRQLLIDYQKQNNTGTKLLLTEAYANLTYTHRFYGNETHEGSQIPFNFGLISSFKNNNATELKNLIDAWMSSMPKGREANWVLGNHDNSRVGSRFGADLIPVLNTLLLTLPGVVITYQGEEIGMIDNTDITWEETKDPQSCNKNDSVNFIKFSRDPERTPYQWDDTENAGFMSSSQNKKPWLPINKNYKILNLAAQKKAPKSIYKHYKSLVALRKTSVFLNGNLEMTTFGEKVFAYSRSVSDSTFVVLLNLGDKKETVNLKSFTKFNDTSIVVLAGPNSEYKEGAILVTSAIELKPYDSVIFQESSGTSLTISVILLIFVAIYQSLIYF